MVSGSFLLGSLLFLFFRDIHVKSIKNMKRTILILVISVTILTHRAEAQAAFGLKGGLNLTTLNVKDPQLSYESRNGYHAGLFLRGKFDKIGIQPEVLLFTQRGEMESTLFGTAQESFTYLSIPLMLKFYPVGGLNLQVGPQFGFLIDGERKYDSFLGGGTRDITEYYKKSDVSVSVGGGYDFSFGLGLDVRYNLGVKDINNVADEEEARSRIFLVSIGWNFLR